MDNRGSKLFSKYEILEELGRGGFGTVYKAEDKVLGRLVAIKMLHPALLVETNFIERFRQEARIAARLDHPNLVLVHDFGQIDGKYYLSMGYMPGGSLKDLLKREGKLEPKCAYEILAQVCDGLEYAHARGIIHRDLKPGNILFDENGKARVADMGFAKVMSEGASRSMSTSGSLIGTPAYMAPETWRNKPATPQTDIYSLGCILYEMLTGKVLFEGESPAEIMTRHMIDGPQYVADLPKVLRPVLDKALQSDPQARFVDVKALLTGFKSAVEPEREEITPLSSIESNSIANSESKPLEERVNGEDSSEGQIHGSEVLPDNSAIRHWQGLVLRNFRQGKLEVEVHNDENQRRKKRSILSKILLVALLLAGLIMISRFYIRSIPWGKMTGTEIITSTNTNQVNQVGRTRFLWGEFEYYMVIENLAWSPDGKTIASTTFNNAENIILWNTENGLKIRSLEEYYNWVNSTAWSPDGKILSIGGSEGRILLCEAESGTELRTLDGNTDDDVVSVAWTPDGKTLASVSGDGTIIYWEIASGKELRTLKVSEASLVKVWSPDGKRLASGGEDGKIRLWDADSGERLQTLEGHTQWVWSVAWSPDGTKLASGDRNGTIILWDAISGERLKTLEEHTSITRSVAWSPDGKMLASGSNDNTIILWDADSGERLQTLEGQRGVTSVAWSPDGKTLASGSDDGTIRLWGIP